MKLLQIIRTIAAYAFLTCIIALLLTCIGWIIIPSLQGVVVRLTVALFIFLGLWLTTGLMAALYNIK